MAISDEKLLGVHLKEAHLVSDVQIQIARLDQQIYGMGLGDILVLHGWIQQQTLDFFLFKWNHLLENNQEYSLEKCLQSAGLLNEQQVQFIKREQIRTNHTFGRIAVWQGWIKPNTLDFFQSAIYKNTISQNKLAA